MDTFWERVVAAVISVLLGAALATGASALKRRRERAFLEQRMREHLDEVPMLVNQFREEQMKAAADRADMRGLRNALTDLVTEVRGLTGRIDRLIEHRGGR